MLDAVAEFATGKLADEHVKEQLVERMSFDAHNGRGALKRKAQTIIDNRKENNPSGSLGFCTAFAAQGACMRSAAYRVCGRN